MTKMMEEELAQAKRVADYLNTEGTSTVHRCLEHIAALTKELDEARRRTWVQCTTVSNKCLGGCRSMAEHDRYRQHALMQEVENLRPLEALHEDMTRLKREAENECNTLRERVSVLEHDIKGYSELMLLLGDALGMDSVTDVALVERVRRVVKERDAADIERNEASFRMEAAESRLAAIRQRATNTAGMAAIYCGFDGSIEESVLAVARFIIGDDAPAPEPQPMLRLRPISEHVTPENQRLVESWGEGEPSTAEAFATLRAAGMIRLDEHELAMLSLLERRMGLLEQQYNACANRALASAEKCDHLTRRMGAMERELREFIENHPCQPDGCPTCRSFYSALTDAPDVFTREEVEGAASIALVDYLAVKDVPGASFERCLRQRLDALRKT